MESRFSLRSLSLLLPLLFCAPATAAAPAKDSLYQTKSQWVDPSGKTMKLEELRGKPVVITMVYTRCQYTCPLIVKKLKDIEKTLADKPDLRFVMVSFDHKNDTPAVLRKFMEEKELDAKKWTVIAGKTSGSVRELAALLDISYKQEKNGEYSHSNVVALLDKEGVKRASVNGISADHAPLAKVARELP